MVNFSGGHWSCANHSKLFSITRDLLECLLHAGRRAIGFTCSSIQILRTTITPQGDSGCPVFCSGTARDSATKMFSQLVCRVNFSLISYYLPLLCIVRTIKSQNTVCYAAIYEILFVLDSNREHSYYCTV